MNTPTDVQTMYANLWAEHGAAAEGVGWKSDVEHHARLGTAASEVLKTAGDLSVLDVGCGYGALLWYLNLPNYGAPFNAQGEVKSYTGLDMNAGALAHLEDSGLHRVPPFPIHLHQSSIEDYTSDFSRHTAVVAVGTLAWHDYATATRMIEAMWKLTDFCLVFTVNVKTSLGLTPNHVIGVLKSLGVSNYRMLHDYGIDTDYMFVCRRYRDKVTSG